ncbi:peptidase U32 family protein [Motiliproteus sediminis]|uniref:peptidase U32 family protein n=1 Tax=Motiliproteus sediminis TaxID=1468178 RepID=UPI001AEFABA5|nr:peptidase U32 family protein [Motiliproteus sediminis]
MVMMMAPGGTKEMAMRVLDAGADSTYVGVKGWSRRGNAEELPDDQIHEVIDYARARDKNVRIVVNTLPSSTEIPMFMERVKMYHEWGATGFMISDIGCMQLVRDQIPTAEVHTSVGCGIVNYADVHFLTELGATYVVLPYRLSVAEIEAIKRENPNTGIEVFLFKTPSGGKICPGKCMMSSYFSFERTLDEEGKDLFFGSASRGGDCLRVCQTEWDLETEAQRHQQEITIKSNPSLWLTELPAYLKAGVGCLKVPGRDRSVELVCDITNVYRRAVDEILGSDAPKLMPLERELQALRERWKAERNNRDDGLISSALAASNRALVADAIGY